MRVYLGAYLDPLPLDVDAPFIRVWGKHYRRVHRIERTYGSLSGPVVVERTLCANSGAAATT